MNRRSMLVSLLGLAATPAVAARMLPMPGGSLLRYVKALRTIVPTSLLGYPIVYGRHESAYLVPPKFASEIIAELKRTHSIVDLAPKHALVERDVAQHALLEADVADSEV